MEKEKKSVSSLLNKAYGTMRPIYGGHGKRGRVLHDAYSKFYKKVFKTANRSVKTNYRVFSQRVTEAKLEVLSDIKKSPEYELYFEDGKVLLNYLQKEILQKGKTLAKENFNIVVPEEIEIELFGGIVSFELDTVGKIGGLNIPAQVDCLIEIDSNKFIVRDFKSYERDIEDDPKNLESQHHRAFMQVCLYAIIFEKTRHQKCEAIQLAYFPNKIILYDFTEDLREQAKKFAIETAFEGFEGISFQFSPEENEYEDEPLKEFDTKTKSITTATTATPPPSIPFKNQGSGDSFDESSLGWINTIKGKPLQLIMGQDNKMEGFLHPNKAHQIKVGYCVIVEKENDGVRIMCFVKKIECSEDCFPGETSSHKEENYKITLIPVGQFRP
ncbi:hypothetical protein LCGC14_2578020, partial [marine sediment metagenome]